MVLAEALAPLRFEGVTVIPYLDNFIIASMEDCLSLAMADQFGLVNQPGKIQHYTFSEDQFFGLHSRFQEAESVSIRRKDRESPDSSTISQYL